MLNPCERDTGDIIREIGILTFDDMDTPEIDADQSLALISKEGFQCGIGYQNSSIAVADGCSDGRCFEHLTEAVIRSRIGCDRNSGRSTHIHTIPHGFARRPTDQFAARRKLLLVSGRIAFPAWKVVPGFSANGSALT